MSFVWRQRFPAQSNAVTIKSWKIESNSGEGSSSWCNDDKCLSLLRLAVVRNDSKPVLIFSYHTHQVSRTEGFSPPHLFRDDPVDAVVSFNETGFQLWMQGEMLYFFEHRIPWTSFPHLQVYPPFHVTPLSGDKMEEELRRQTMQKALWLAQNDSWSVSSISCAGALDFKSVEGHILFHFHPRIGERQIVMNTKFEHRGWDIPEERLDLPPSCYSSHPYFNATISVNATGFHVTYMLNEHQQVSHMYAHRLHALVNSLASEEGWEIRKQERLGGTEHLLTATIDTDGQLLESD